MELTINEKVYELKFGLSFINAIDNIYTQKMHGVEFGMGLEMLNTYLGLGRPTALYNVISAGTSHLNSKPSNTDIELYLEDLAESENEDYENMFDEVGEAMKQAPFLRRTMKNLENAQK